MSSPVLYFEGSSSNTFNISKVTLDLSNLKFVTADDTPYIFKQNDSVTLLSTLQDLTGLKVSSGGVAKPLTAEGVAVGTYKVLDGGENKFYKNFYMAALANNGYDVTYTASANHLSLTDKTGTEKAVTLYAVPEVSDGVAAP